MTSSFSLILSPQGRLSLDPIGPETISRTGEPSESLFIDPDIAPRIEQAFQRGVGYGLLHLGTSELGSALPPPFPYWRDWGRQFVTQLTATTPLSESGASPAGPITVPLPAIDLEGLVLTVPPMNGAEYLNAEVLTHLWAEMQVALLDEVAAFKGDVQAYLKSKNPVWNLMGRVYFHLAEQKGRPESPFAFLATYTSRLSQTTQVQHLVLGKALQEYAGTQNKDGLLRLLLPVQKAATQSPFLKEMVDSGQIFHPQSFTPHQAYLFLKEVPRFESSGIMVRTPDFWKGHRPVRPTVQVSIGKNDVSRLGVDAMLDFSVDVVLNGARLTRDELEQILANDEGMMLIRGQWIEVDRGKLEQMLDHWKSIQRTASDHQLSFAQAMRLLSGAAIGDGPEVENAIDPEWSQVVSGEGLRRALEGLRHPQTEIDPGADLQASLRPYQAAGVKWLWTLHQLGLGACLADDMGLGKTIQIISLLLLLKREKVKPPHLLVIPASLIANWKGEIDRFAPTLKVEIVHPSFSPSLALDGSGKAVDLVITTYGMLNRADGMAETDWGLVILDEAQAIKSPAAKQTRAVKKLKSRHRIALTGTPIENRLSDLWSLFDFICPGLLGSAKAFQTYTKAIAKSDAPSYGPLRTLVHPYILRRLKTDRKIISDLPDKTEMKGYCALTKRQAALYQQSVVDLQEQIQALKEDSGGIRRKGIVLSFLIRLKQICNHPSLWLNDGGFGDDESGKYHRLRELCESISAKQEKVLIFTQFQKMTRPLHHFLSGLFGREGLVLDGDTPVKKRRDLVARFQAETGPPFFILSLKAGGVGLNLTAAAHVIHFDRWWNPAVENQATDRAYRIGQKKNVLVHKFICRGTIEEKIDEMIEAKSGLSQEILSEGQEARLTEMSNEALIQMVSLDIHSALAETG